MNLQIKLRSAAHLYFLNLNLLSVAGAWLVEACVSRPAAGGGLGVVVDVVEDDVEVAGMGAIVVVVVDISRGAMICSLSSCGSGVGVT